MRKYIMMMLVLLGMITACEAKQKKDVWPDGTAMDAWFQNRQKVDVATLGKRYVITDYGVKSDSTIVQTAAIQAVIDRAAKEQGGVIVIPRGTFLSGAIFFRQGTHLLVEEGGKLKGSERIQDFPIAETRMEGQTCKYFTALVNADKVDGFTIAGQGTIDGNGYHYWNEFWIRRQWNRQCTNKDAQRPRLVYISNSKNVTVQDVHLQNSPFWTNHIYRSDHVRYLDCTIYAPTSGVKAPSSDAIDLDVCHDVLIDGCSMTVNDDAVVLKGGKGTWADKAAENGPNYNILVQNCHYGIVHGCLTLGSESLTDRNVILRNIQVDKAQRVLWLKMRPDTPQHYEYVTVDNIKGSTGSFLVVRPWTQFFQKENRDDMPLSQCNNIVMKNVKMDCKNFFDVGKSDKYYLRDFTFEGIDVQDEKQAFDPALIDGVTVKNVTINGVKQKNLVTQATQNVGQSQVARKFTLNLSADGECTLTCYLPAKPTGRAIVDCPGGGYSHLAMDHEGHDWAPYFNNKGIAFFVLKYRMPHGDRSIPMGDAFKAMRTVRDSATVWRINPEDVGIMGFSAGGHLASTVSTHAEAAELPNFSILFYPVISMDEKLTHKGSCVNFLGDERLTNRKLVDEFSNQNAVKAGVTPRAIILMANNDTAVPPVTNGIAYYSAMQKAGNECTMNVYPSGGHGFGFRANFAFHDQMLRDLTSWLDSFKAEKDIVFE